VAVGLEASRQHQLHEVAHMDARRGRVESDVGPHLPAVQGGAERVQIGGVGDEPTPGQFFEQGVHAAQG